MILKTVHIRRKNAKSSFRCLGTIESLKIAIFCYALFVCTIIRAQSSFADSLKTKFVQYQLNHLQEKIFVHTDKSFYLTGELMWFKAYCLDASFHKPLDNSKVLYLEILNTEKKPVVQTKIFLDGGTGNGSLVLPSYLSSGNYLLRAYTNWMKNFSPDFYFEKIFTLVNPVRKPEWPVRDSAQVPVVTFFPEGGNLVYGLENKLAFRVTDKFQKGIDCTGILVDQDHDTIATFSSLKFGIGNFIFMPVAGKTYKVLIQANENAYAYDLPMIYEHGYVLRVIEENQDRLKVRVSIKNEGSPKQLFLVVHNSNSVQRALMQETINNMTEFVLEKRELSDGISTFTIFNENRQPVCERLFFKRPTAIMEINAKTDAETYKTRKKINIELQTGDFTGKKIAAEISLSVFLSDSLPSFQNANILSWLWLSSELKGRIEDPGYYFRNDDQHVSLAMDNLMLTHGWRRFRWDDVLIPKKPYFEFVPEYAGHIITGRVTDKANGNPARGITSYLSIPGQRFYFNSSVSNERGQVFFDVKKLYGTGNIIIHTNHLHDSAYRVDISSPFSDQFSVNLVPPFDLSDKWKDQLVKNISNLRVYNNYASDLPQKFYLPDDVDTFAFYGPGDRTYFLDDFTRFGTMEEVMREYVTEVQVKRTKSDFHYRVANMPYKLSFDTDPLILLDGTPVFETNKIMAFDPLKIKKLDVVARKFYQGAIAYDGIVSYSTYQGDLGGFQLDPNSLILEYQGLQLQRQFYSPTYESSSEANSRIPDFRSVLYWSPDVKTDQNGKTTLSFYTSDLPGRYTVIVQGISESGLPGVATSGFIVNE